MADQQFCGLATAPREDGGEAAETRLTFMYGGWAGRAARAPCITQRHSQGANFPGGPPIDHAP